MLEKPRGVSQETADRRYNKNDAERNERTGGSLRYTTYAGNQKEWLSLPDGLLGNEKWNLSLLHRKGSMDGWSLEAYCAGREEGRSEISWCTNYNGTEKRMSETLISVVSQLEEKMAYLAGQGAKNTPYFIYALLLKANIELLMKFRFSLSFVEF